MSKLVSCVYSGNDKYFNQIFLSALSMAMHTKEALQIYIVTIDCETKRGKYLAIRDDQVAYLDEVLKKYNKESRAILLNINEVYYNNMPASCKNKNSVYTPYTLLRLFLNKLDNLPSKLIYIDTDTMVYNDINELYSIDLANYEYAAVQDVVGHHFFGKKYCNAGVLLLNLDKIKETKLFEKCIDYVVNKRSFMPDQDAINYRTTSKLMLDRRFNEQRAIKPNTVIKHFCKIPKWFPYIHTINIKQTNRDGVHNILKIHEFDDVFEVYDRLRLGHEELLFN